MDHFYVAYHTDIGIKKKTNQDSILLKGIKDGDQDSLLCVICDGMGGIEKGELASATAVRAFSKWFENVYIQKGSAWTSAEVWSQWADLLADTNKLLTTYGKKHHIQLGTTVTVLLITSQNKYVLGHIGDTRVYHFQDHMEQLTEDHTFVAREVRRGNMTAEQAAQDNRRNVLLQCIGVNQSFTPQFLEGKLGAGDAFLLCSDGFRHVVTEHEIYMCLKPEKIPDEVAAKKNLIHLAELNKQRRETDNISAVYIKRK